MNYAPIGICTYTRIEHLKKTVHALSKNTLAKKCDLFIFSDGPRKGDEKKVETLRQYLPKINGFKKVHLIYQKKNNLFENTVGAMRTLANNYGQFIFMEDDNLSSEHYLTFMNEALDKYKDDPRVHSIGGYTPPILIPKSYTYDVFFTPIFCPWGLAMWKDRLSFIDFERTTNQFRLNKNLENKLKYTGKSIFRRSKNIYKNDHPIQDVMSTVINLKENFVTVLPKISMINNIGNDNSGLRCGNEREKYDTVLNSSFIPKNYPPCIFCDKKIDNELYLFNSYQKHPRGIKKKWYLQQRNIHNLSSTITDYFSYTIKKYLNKDQDIDDPTCNNPPSNPD